MVALRASIEPEQAREQALTLPGQPRVSRVSKAGRKASEKSHLLTSGSGVGPKKTIAKKPKGAAKKAAAAPAAAEDNSGSQAPTVIASSQVGGDNAVVCVDEVGAFLEAQLSQIEVKSNTDKFYTLQVVHDTSSEEYFCVAHWGRTGTKGDSKVDGPYDSQADAVASF